MRAEALALLEDPAARRLVATWPYVKGDPKQEHVIEAWAKLAAVSFWTAFAFAPGLVAAAICQPKGVVDADAALYLKRLSSLALGIAPRERGTGRSKTPSGTPRAKGRT